MMMLAMCPDHRHLPAFPIKGDVPLHSFDSISSQPPADTCPLMGAARRGGAPHAETRNDH